MATIGLDLHKRESQLCITHADGRFEERRTTTSRDRFTAVLGSLAPARILLESGTGSEWVARHLERMGHEVIVADPNFAPNRAARVDRSCCCTPHDCTRDRTGDCECSGRHCR